MRIFKTLILFAFFTLVIAKNVRKNLKFENLVFSRIFFKKYFLWIFEKPTLEFDEIKVNIKWNLSIYDTANNTRENPLDVFPKFQFKVLKGINKVGVKVL